MAFERRSSEVYFYLSYRDPISGATRKRYFGRGKRAEAEAAALVRRNLYRQAEHLAVEGRRIELRAADELAAELDAAVTILLEAALLAAGYHRVNYGRWRRKRSANDNG